MKIIQKTLATLCFVSVAFCSTAYSADKVTLRFAHPMTKVSSVAKGYIKFKHLVEAASGGDIEVQFYENQSFFGDARMNVGFMLDGTLDMTALSSSNLSYFVPELMAFSVPYIVQPKNQDKLYAAIDNGALGTTLDDAIEKVGAIPLMYSEYGYRNFASVDTPLKSLNDLKGLKLRICDSQAEKSLDEALMMKPKYYAWGAVPMLLRLGFIEGESNKFAAMYQADHADRLGHESRMRF